VENPWKSGKVQKRFFAIRNNFAMMKACRKEDERKAREKRNDRWIILVIYSLHLRLNLPLKPPYKRNAL
jgi:hypothetical protein